MTDVELLLSAQRGEHGAAGRAVERFRALALAATADLFLVGADRDDLEQEALIGILHAVRTFDAARTGNPAAFVKLCVRRHLLACVTRTHRLMSRSLNESVRTIVDDERPVAVTDVLPDPHSDPLDVLLRREEVRAVVGAWRTLSQVERGCLRACAAGLSYRDIEDVQGLPEKRIDNALYRARRKLRAAA